MDYGKLRFDPPRCSRYGCDALVSRERWLWNRGSTATCSPECASAMAREAGPARKCEVQRCARPGCGNPIKPGNAKYCSRRCSGRVQHGESAGKTLRIAPQPQADEIEWPGQCARPGCENPVTRARNRYCSRSCAAIQNGGERWEKDAPRMSYTQDVRAQMVKEIYLAEVTRGAPSYPRPR
jgi:hypothetical protein